MALNDLKQTMTDEFSNKQREFEKLRASFEDLVLQLSQTQSTVRSRESEISGLRETIAEKTSFIERQSE